MKIKSKSKYGQSMMYVNLWLPLFLAISDQVSLPRYMSVQNTFIYRNAYAQLAAAAAEGAEATCEKKILFIIFVKTGLG
jgi:hypothetical protein